MIKKLYILLIFSNLMVAKLLNTNHHMHNLFTIFAKFLEICKEFSKEIVNEKGNLPRVGVVPRFSDLEVIALSLTAEALSIDSENYLFQKLREYNNEMPNLISRRQYNDRRKYLSQLCEKIRKRIATHIDGDENIFCIDSKPIEVCRVSRGKRSKMSNDYHTAPNFGYCASQGSYYFGYKLHAVCGLNGVIHSYDLTQASVHDIKYLNDVKQEYSNCQILGDRGYISKEVQLDLFETANIQLDVPYRLNQKDWKPQFIPYAKARKRIETVFSQLNDQFMLLRNYAKKSKGVFTRIIGKISAYTFLQYINYSNNKSIGRVKYALS